jgi:chemotaxis protein MotB
MTNRRCKCEEEAGDDATFYMSYGDMVTLLLVFFVYLTAISTLDEVKYIIASQSIQNVMEVDPPTEGLYEKLQSEKAAMKDLTEKIEEYIFENQMETQVTLTKKENLIIMEVGDSILFDSGSAKLKLKAYTMLNMVINELTDVNTDIVVEGHTDNVPINTDIYPSNWELSSARAASVASYFQKKGIRGDRITCIGKGKFAPIKTNSTTWGRRKNRRIVIQFKIPDIFKEPINLDDELKPETPSYQSQLKQ